MCLGLASHFCSLTLFLANATQLPKRSAKNGEGTAVGHLGDASTTEFWRFLPSVLVFVLFRGANKQNLWLSMGDVGQMLDSRCFQMAGIFQSCNKSLAADF